MRFNHLLSHRIMAAHDEWKQCADSTQSPSYYTLPYFAVPRRDVTVNTFAVLVLTSRRLKLVASIQKVAAINMVPVSSFSESMKIRSIERSVPELEHTQESSINIQTSNSERKVSVDIESSILVLLH